MQRMVLVCLIAMSGPAFCGEYRFDSAKDKRPAKATYTIDGEFMQSVEAPEDLVGLRPPFVIAAAIQVVDNDGDKPQYSAEMYLDFCRVDELGLPKEADIETRYWFRLMQDEGTDLAYLNVSIDCVGNIGPLDTQIPFGEVEELVARVNSDGSFSCWVNVDDGDGGTVRVPLYDSGPCIENGALYSWRVPTWRTVWIDWISITGPQVPDRNAGSDKESSGDVNDDGVTNATDIQFVINKVLGVSK